MSLDLSHLSCRYLTGLGPRSCRARVLIGGVLLRSGTVSVPTGNRDGILELSHSAAVHACAHAGGSIRTLDHPAMRASITSCGLFLLRHCTPPPCALDPYVRSSIGTYSTSSGPLYRSRGRRMSLAVNCSTMCAAQPGIRPIANRGTNRSSGIPRRE